MIELQRLAKENVIPAAAQGRPFLFLLIGFGMLVSLFPFHSWAPPAYASAPTPAAMLHAGVLKKFGLYGLLRLAVPLLPEGAQRMDVASALCCCVANIIYIGLVTIAQRKLDLMLGYSSVMHMGYIFLGIAALNIVGLSGAALLMFAHGLSIASLFALAGIIRERNLTLSFESLGGLAQLDAVPWARSSASPRSPPSACPASPISPAKSWSSSAPSSVGEATLQFSPMQSPPSSRSGAWSSPPSICCAPTAASSWANPPPPPLAGPTSPASSAGP